MSSGKTRAGLALLLALLTGCATHQLRTTPPPVAQIPSLPPVQMASLIAPMPPVFPPVQKRPIKLDTTAPPEATTEAASVEPRHPTRRRTKPSTPESATPETAKATTTEAPSPAPEKSAELAANQPPENSPLGPLTTANDNSNMGDRHDISEQIDATESGVNGIKRVLSSDEQKTAASIRVYISKARDALKADDLVAARTLASKAHQLLEQLLKG